MKHLAAYLLLVAGGNESPTAADVKDLLGKSDIAVDDERLNQLINELSGKNLEEIIESGKSQLIPLMRGGGGGGQAATDNDAPVEEKKEVVKEEEVDALEGGMSMFGGDGGDY
eukprot:TRINITY_DN63763_c0_g3_i1.p1 TRINITY_DN63763_c0_g3~~TRINITY_DN63763_c0_g3_i1.p1  ORF type:complete len:113 (+),score=32.10 TRINITY_DN63763_c0_g3_i1:116-454(+)